MTSSDSDPAPIDGRRHLGRGLLWLGSAAGAARVIDLVALWAVMLFLPAEEIGVATLAWTVAVVAETTNGFGIGVAIVQAPKLNKNQLSSAFWFSVIGALIVGVVVIGLVGPIMAYSYDEPRLALFMWVVALKILAVSTFAVPFQLLNRALRYREIAALKTAATLVAALTRVAVAAAGGGAWAIVLGHGIHGVVVLVGVYLIAPFWPLLRFKFQEIRSLVSFGVPVALTDGFNQAYRNLDYFVVGHFFGMNVLGAYTVAFNIAMEPAIAAGEVVSRSSLPVFSRLASMRASLLDGFYWAHRMLGRITFPVAAATAVLIFDVAPLLEKFTEESYAAIALPVVFLCAAALMRAHYQLFAPLMQGVGAPGVVLRFAAFALALFAASFGLVFMVAAEGGMVSVAAAWVLVYPVLGLSILAVARRRIGARGSRILAVLAAPAAGALLATGCALGLRQLFDDPSILSVVASAIAFLLAYVASQIYFQRFAWGRMPAAPEGPASKEQSVPEHAPNAST